MLEKEFYKLVTPEGKQNYILEGQAKLLLLLCQEVDKLVAAQQSVQADECPEWVDGKHVWASSKLGEFCQSCGTRR